MSNKPERIEWGEYIVADAHICRGQPTFKGTRLLVGYVLSDLLEGKNLDEIASNWARSISREAVVEAIRLAILALEERYRVPPAEIDLKKLFGESEEEYDKVDKSKKEVQLVAMVGDDS